ncbi:MAG: iron ABC transporter permease [Pseudomonadales bacterium]|nr:iron ABC transporter permease [Pseudomonadales bacterium]
MMESSLSDDPDRHDLSGVAESGLWQNRCNVVFALLLFAIVIVFLLALTIGSISIPVESVVRSLLGADSANPVWDTILWELRLPRAITAACCGAALGSSGLLLQTLFRNPLAGPWALGLTGGAQLGVALVIATGSVVGSSFLLRLDFLSGLGIVTGAIIGSSLIAIIVSTLSRNVTTMTLLIAGLMLGYLAEGMVSVVLHFTTEMQGRVFASWNDGSFNGVGWEQFPVLLTCLTLGTLLSLGLVKPLNALLLGEQYAASLGLPVTRARLVVLAGAVMLAGPVTAFCGPVLFIGIIVPHMARGLFNTSDHRILMPGALLLGAIVALTADLIVHLPWERHFLHLNAVNAVVGAPFVLWILLRNRHTRAMEI